MYIYRLIRSLRGAGAHARAQSNPENICFCCGGPKLKRIACCSIVFRPQLVISLSSSINLMLADTRRMRDLSSEPNFERNSQTSDRGESLKVTCQLSLLSISRRTSELEWRERLHSAPFDYILPYSTCQANGDESELASGEFMLPLSHHNDQWAASYSKQFVCPISSVPEIDERV